MRETEVKKYPELAPPVDSGLEQLEPGNKRLAKKGKVDKNGKPIKEEVPVKDGKSEKEQTPVKEKVVAKPIVKK